MTGVQTCALPILLLCISASLLLCISASLPLCISIGPSNGSSCEGIVPDNKQKTNKIGLLIQKYADLKSGDVLPSMIDGISERGNEEELELQLHSLQVKLKKSEKKNRKLRSKNDRIIQDILLFNHQHNHKLEEENTHLLRGCNEMKELLGCECILEYDEVLSRRDLEKNKIEIGRAHV